MSTIALTIAAAFAGSFDEKATDMTLATSSSVATVVSQAVSTLFNSTLATPVGTLTAIGMPTLLEFDDGVGAVVVTLGGGTNVATISGTVAPVTVDTTGGNDIPDLQTTARLAAMAPAPPAATPAEAKPAVARAPGGKLHAARTNFAWQSVARRAAAPLATAGLAAAVYIGGSQLLGTVALPSLSHESAPDLGSLPEPSAQEMAKAQRRRIYVAGGLFLAIEYATVAKGGRAADLNFF